MHKIVPIVEGDGEVTAVPALLYEILHQLQRYDIHIAPPKNAHGRDNLKVAGGLEKFVRHASKERDCAAILVLIDSEGECPQDIAKDFCVRILAMGIRVPTMIVCAHCMYETWLVASIETVAGNHLEGRVGLPGEIQPPEDVEAIPGAKTWLNARFPKGRAYKETEDQVAMTRLIDTALVRQRSRSFRRLWHAIEEATAAIDQGVAVVTPVFPEELA